MSHHPIFDRVPQLRNRDEEAFVEFVRVFEETMLRVAFRIVGDQADAEEVRQTFFLRIWQDPTRVPANGSLQAWVFRCVVNEAMTLTRRRKREKILHERFGPPADEVAESPTCNEEHRRLRAAMQKLSAEDRGVLALYFDDELSIRQIAEILRRPHTTVHARIKRLLTRLRAALE